MAQPWRLRSPYIGEKGKKMDIIRMIVLFCILLLYPLLPGGLLLSCTGKGKKETVSRIFLYGCLLCGGLFSVMAFFGVRKGVDFSVFSKIVLLVFLGLAAGCALCIWRMKKYRECMAGILRDLKRKPDWRMAVCVLAFLLVGALYVVRPFPMEAEFSAPDRVVTVLDTGMLNGVNVMTAEAAQWEGNWKAQICNLPVFYACLSDWSGLSPAKLLFSVIPFVVLFSAFLVISLFADLFLGEEKEKNAGAWLLFAVITLCGNAAYMNTSYGLLHFPYEAKTIFSCILLPLLFLALKRKENMVWPLLIFVNGVFLVGVSTAGMIAVFMLLVYGLSVLVSFLAERRGNPWK